MEPRQLNVSGELYMHLHGELGQTCSSRSSQAILPDSSESGRSFSDRNSLLPDE